MGKGTFDLVANFYPWLEQMVFGSALSRSRNFFAQRIAEGNRILLIGEGNGRFLVEIAKQTSSASFTVVDSSARMLADSARRLATIDGCPRVEFIQADILEWRAPPGNYDRVVTHFFLDLFTPQSICRIIEKISRVASEGTLWINVDFRSENGSFGEKAMLWAQYRFFRMSAGIEASRLYSPLPCIEEAGWQVLESRSLQSGWISAHLMGRRPTQP